MIFVREWGVFGSRGVNYRGGMDVKIVGCWYSLQMYYALNN